jgi:uncharacterized membrane protein YdjX (TVP38/TMEM64 family)
MGIKPGSAYDGTKRYQRPVHAEVFSWQRLAIVALFFLLFFVTVRLLWQSLPAPLEQTNQTTSTTIPRPYNGWLTYFPPTNLDDAKGLGLQLGHYTDSHYFHVMLVYVITYIFLQTFAIPGSIFLSILSGALFWFPVALFLVCMCAAIGASCANMLSAFLGRGLVEKYMQSRLDSWRQLVAKNRDNLFNFILFLRITPLVPNFFVNIASPLVNVPLHVFFIGTFFGVAPPSMLFIKAGRTLQQLTTASAPLSTLVGLTVMGFVSLLPVLYKERIRQKFE